MEALKLSLKYPSNYGYLCRRTYEDFKKTTMKTFFDFVPSELIKEYNRTDKTVTIINGSVIQFGDLETTEKLKSLNIGWFAIDEASECSKDIFILLISRLRYKKDEALSNWNKVEKSGLIFYVPKYYGLLASNPCPGWIKESFVEDGIPDKEGIIRTSSGYVFIPSLPRENPFLPEDYLNILEANANKDWVHRYLNGSWNTFEGQIYEDFDVTTHVIEPFPIPEIWNHYRSIDLGVEDPTACLFIAFSPEGIIYIYDEYYESNRSTEEHAEDICIMSGKQKYRTIFDHHGLGKQLIIDYNRLGIKGTEHKFHKVIAGISRVQDLIRLQGKVKKPRLFVFSNCRNTIKEFQSYQWELKKDSESNSKEKPMDKNNHAMDCIKNLVITYYYQRTPTKDEIQESMEKKMRRDMFKFKVSELTGY